MFLSKLHIAPSLLPSFTYFTNTYNLKRKKGGNVLHNNACNKKMSVKNEYKKPNRSKTIEYFLNVTSLHVIK